MTYSEEEITQYLNIFKNFENGKDVYAPVLENLPPKIP